MPEELIITLYCISLSGGRIPLSGFTSTTEQVELENVLEEFAGEWVSPYGAMAIVAPSQNYQFQTNGAEDIESYGLFLISSLALSESAFREAHSISIQDDPVTVPGLPIAQVYHGNYVKIVLSQLESGDLALNQTSPDDSQIYNPVLLKSIERGTWITAAKEALGFYIDFLEKVLLPYYKDAGIKEEDYFGITRQIEISHLLLAR
jgi:hypothetical protein